jgi:hypothetical protein
MHRAHEPVVVRSEVVQRADVAAGDDQHVQRRLRVDVPDGDELVVLVNEPGWNLAADDPAEEAIVHRF